MGSYPNDPRNARPASMPGGPMWAGAPQRPDAAPVMVAQGPKWSALRFIAVLFKIFAWIELVVGIILALSTAFAGSFLATHTGINNANIGGASILAAIIVFIVPVLGFILNYAIAELILVLITIEKNTRKY